VCGKERVVSACCCVCMGCTAMHALHLWHQYYKCIGRDLCTCTDTGTGSAGKAAAWPVKSAQFPSNDGGGCTLGGCGKSTQLYVTVVVGCSKGFSCGSPKY
jgi:hypothetical protein